MSGTITGMGIHTWESHLESRGAPVLEGTWDDGTPWKFYEHEQEVPDALPIRTAMCVPVCSIDLYNPQVGLTLSLRRGGYEIPGGHRDPLANGELETPATAAARELTEETGLRTAPAMLVPYGYAEARNDPDSPYPPYSYMQFFAAHTPGRPGRITDPEVDGAGIFTLDALRTMTERGAMRTTELGLVCVGVRAVLRHHGLPDGHIALP